MSAALLPERCRHALGDLFETPLVDLGATDRRYAGIACPLPELGAERVGITEQFLGHADIYDQLYSNSPHFDRLFTQALATPGLVVADDPMILDIGTGSGTNTIQPALTLFPGCRIVGTDLSPDLLAMLQGYLVKQALTDRVLCVCTDAMNNHFRPESFDVVVGAAILHHLLDPRLALATVHRALKPGGFALFFEPFDGLLMIRLGMDLILDRAERERRPLHPGLERLLRAVSLDYATRAGPDKSAAHFRYMDDKWLFNRQWLQDAAAAAGFAAVTVLPHATHETSYADYLAETMKLGAGLDRAALPDWGWETIAVLDRSSTPALKQELVLEGTIVLRKA